MNKEDVLHLSKISKLSFSEEELIVFEKEIEGFLEMTRMRDISASNLEDKNHVGVLDLREDRIISSFDDGLACAEKTKDNGFLIPKIL